MRAMSSTSDVRYVLVADQTLMSDYRHLPLGQFMSCIPSDVLPARLLHTWIAPTGPHVAGRATFAPTGLRKVEAALVASEGGESVVVAHPDHVGRFIGPRTEVVGIHTMDPLGLGPVSMMFSPRSHFIPHTRWGFERLVGDLPQGGYKLAVGGPGSWQLEHRPEDLQRLGIDVAVVGEIDATAPDVFKEIADGSMHGVVRIRTHPDADEIPANLGGTVLGLVEVMRGCGRGCKFCQPALRRARYIPMETVLEDIRANASAGLNHVWVLSDDIFLYRLEDRREVRPNTEAVVELFKLISSAREVHTLCPTHGSLAPVVADPGMVEELTGLIRPMRKWIGIQPGLETGSVRLIERLMPRKALPFGPDEWPDVVCEAVRILNANKWYPSLTLMMGLPGEEKEDLEETLDLLDRLEGESERYGGKYLVAPLCFVPQGALREEGWFDVVEMASVHQLRVIHRCWRHILKTIDEDLRGLLNLSPATRSVISMVARVGGRFILNHIERHAHRIGGDVAA